MGSDVVREIRKDSVRRLGSPVAAFLIPFTQRTASAGLRARVKLVVPSGAASPVFLASAAAGS